MSQAIEQQKIKHHTSHMTSGGYSAKTEIVFDELACNFQLIERARVYMKKSRMLEENHKIFFMLVF
jgi:hypothetical protein